MARNDIPNLSRKEEIVLDMLAGSKPRYGLDLADSSDGAISRSAVYVTLARMVKKGFIESKPEDQEPGDKGLPRKLYRITGMGERALRAKQLTRAVMAGEWVGV